MKTIVIEGQLRAQETLGSKSALHQLRKSGQVPGVIYGGAENIHFHAPAKAFKPLIHTSEFQLAELRIDGKSYRCVLKDRQFDPLTDELIHVDFLQLVEDRKVTVTLPILFTGTPEGVKQGGKLVVKMKSLKVRTYPRYLKEHIEVNLDHLGINQNIRVENVRVENFEILHAPRIPLASVVATRAVRQEEAAAAQKS
ncbi:LSU ribosomal protein L25P [Thermoflavifilum aggregans]|uniref:Large ribosomal subunit protein bL25 n=1 Tax=Thermoflavifilum aggregans TaxID=454188 RepID=A0A2M9CTS2_9BACT|nr:50S ribosomal protein L25 [Thermoflavifilum aggregans]PJJ75218.1 LSU ribosomal protein L25P [Thermoflavifilum aggregans]